MNDDLFYRNNLSFSKGHLELLKRKAKDHGYSSLDDFTKQLLLNFANKPHTDLELNAQDKVVKFYKTKHGDMWHGNALDWLNRRKKSSVNLIMTSPPFGLLKKKSYGNESEFNYCDWFRPFAEHFHRVLTDDGSLVIDIGGSWKKGMPSRSLYHYKLLIMLCEEYGFHLALEHYWWNPAKLPTPAEWVNVRRIRPKDAVNCIWWLSKTPYPKASNRRILSPYSTSMERLIKNGYKANTRPSGHIISNKFNQHNGGSVPPNLLAIANTESTGNYHDYCRANGIPAHPARFPSSLPEYFIRMTTNPGDFVLDPFGGSCVTGAVSEALKRKWACIDLNSQYLEAAKSRFIDPQLELSLHKGSSYSISTPCSLDLDESNIDLPRDGGKTKP